MFFLTQKTGIFDLGITILIKEINMTNEIKENDKERLAKRYLAMHASLIKRDTKSAKISQSLIGGKTRRKEKECSKR